MRISDWSSDVCSSDLRIGDGVGFDANVLRSREAFWFAPGLHVTPTGMHHVLSGVQPQQQPDEREPVRRATLAELIADASVIRSPEQDGPFASLYPDREPGKYAGAMRIDLTERIASPEEGRDGKERGGTERSR